MRKKLLLLLLCLLCLPGFAGCSLSTMERQTFAICFSIDIDEQKQITLAVETPMNGSGTNNAAAPQYTVFSATAKSFEETMTLLAASTPCPLNFSQLKLCIIGYELAASTELRPLIVALARISSMRPDALVMIAMGSAQEVVINQIPDFGMRMSTHLNMYMGRLQSDGLMPRSTIMECVRTMDGGRADQLLGICAINPALMKKPGGSEGESDSQKKNDAAAFSNGEPWLEKLLEEKIIAGAIPRTGINPVEYLGSAAMGNGRISGLLTAEETQIVLELQRTAVLKVALDGDKTQLQIWLSPKLAEQMPLDKVTDTVGKLQALHCDALGFSGLAAACVYTNREWKELNMERRYAEAEIMAAIR